MDIAGTKDDGESEKGPSPLEPFILLAKRDKGAAAVKLIHQALEAPNLYVFSELLDAPNIAELKDNPEYQSHHKLLELFAYGIYSEYNDSISSYPEITDQMRKKLRHLTLVSLAMGQKSLPLSHLASQLSLNSTRELEDLIIEAIYADIISGRLDQKNGVLEVEYAIGRDIKPEDLINIERTLKAWCQTCNTMLGNVDQLITQANLNKEEHLKHKNSLEQEIHNMKATLKAQAVESDEQMVSESKDCEKKRTTKKAVRVTSSKFWQKS